jgi:putative transposase
VVLRDAVERIVVGFPGKGSYGYRRVTAALRREGWRVNHKRVLRIMRRESLLCQLKRRFAPTTDSAHSFRRYPNLIEDIELQEPDECWVADITYVRLPSTFCYLAAILKGHPPYALGTSDGALFSPGCCGALIHHSDQGVQYASSEYVIRLEEAGARISMASVDNPYENAKAESFFRRLKMEEVYLKA